MGDGRIFKTTFFGFSKKDVLSFFEKLSQTEEEANEKKDKEIQTLTKAVFELTEKFEKLKNENKCLLEELDILKASISAKKSETVQTELVEESEPEKTVSTPSIDQAIDDAKSFYSKLLTSSLQPEEQVIQEEKKEFDPKNSDLYCEMMKEIEALRMDKEETKRQFEEAIEEIREGYEKKLAEKNDEIYARRQKYFNAVMEHIQYKRTAEKQLHAASKDIEP